MSTSTLYRVYPKRVEQHAEFKNGRDTAIPLWDYLARKHLRWSDHWQHTNSPEEDKALWRLARDPQVPRVFRICHAMTFDYALLLPEHRREAINACEEVGKSVFLNGNRWREVGYQLRHGKNVDDPKLIGFGLNCTSVNDIWAGCNPKKAPMFDLMRLIVKPL